jgi:hypothetical protein
MNQRGFEIYAIMFIMIIMGMVTVFVFVAPVLQNFVASSYVAMEPTLQKTEDKINQMDNNEMRAAALGTIQAQQDNIGLNIEIFGNMFLFSAILVIIILLVVVFMVVKSNTEVGSQVQ